MPRSSMDPISQRVLVHQLKRAIDMLGRDSGADTRLRHLVAMNPRSARSTHVIGNLGAGRVAALEAILGESLGPRARATSPSDTDADSSSSSEA